MVANQEVIDYLNKLPDAKTAQFKSLTPEEQAKNIFEVTEMLGDFYRPTRLNPRIVALQLLFMLESEGEEYARLKRHGIGQMSTKDTSVTFSRSDALAPDVVVILGEPLTSLGKTARLV